MSADHAKLLQLLNARQPCVAMITVEESYALSVAREVAADNGFNVRVWSVTRGISDGLLADAPIQPDTDHPAAALVSLTRDRSIRTGVIVFLDLIGHLKDERTMRAFREAIDARSAAGDTIVLIDPNGELPPAVRSVTAKLELTFPDEVELEAIVKSSLREMNELNNRQIKVDISRATLDAMIRNLRGLSRRQARQII